MLRRNFVKSLGAIGAATISPKSLMASTIAELSSPQERNITEVSAFHSSYLNVPEYYEPTQVSFDKALPTELSGTLYRNGPALFQRGPSEYKHWFDGDGMIHSSQMRGSSLVHKASMVQTSRYIAEKHANRFLWPGFGTSIEDGRPVTGADDMNVANISVLPVQDELWALWEGGSAWQIDPESLETKGRKVFSDETDGLSFSAHPRVDSDGRIWNFGYVSGADTLILYDIAANGTLSRVKVVDAPYTNMVHDFAVTEQYLIFVLFPLTYDASQANGSVAFAKRLGWDDKAPASILVINKSSLEVAHRFEMPALFAFHFGNAWQDGRQIRVELAASDPWEQLNSEILKATQGLPLHSHSNTPSTEIAAVELVIDLVHKHVSVETLPIIGADFPVFDGRYVGLPTNHLTMLNRSGSMSSEIFGFNQLIQFDRQSGKTQTYDYGSDVIVEEHVFVPQAGKQEGTGWLLGTSYNWRTQSTSLSVFNATALKDGPVTTAELPYHLPLGLHGKFVGS